MDIFENQESIKSKGRVQELGEVYTPKYIVNDMLDIDGIKDKASQIDATFLEPSCGNGNFIVEILLRKTKVVLNESKTQEEFDINTLKAVSSIYGIDIMHDNIVETKERMLDIIKSTYDIAGYSLDNLLIKNITYVMDRNIILGNSLENKMANIEDATRKKRKNSIVQDFNLDLVINEWVFNGGTVTRHSFRLCDIENELAIKYKSVEYKKLYTLADIEEEEIDI